MLQCNTVILIVDHATCFVNCYHIIHTMYINIKMIKTPVLPKLYTLQMPFHISKIHFDIFIHSYAPSIATGFPIHSIFL